MGPILAVLSVALVLPIAYGVALPDELLALAYQLAYVVAPGCFAYQALRSSRRVDFEGLVVGWAFGYLLNIAAFLLTAAAGGRELFLAYPAVVIGVAIAMLRRARPAGTEGPQPFLRMGPLPRSCSWSLAGLAALALVYVAVAQFSLTPLPSTGRTVLYHPDDLFHLSVAAEALHHWPILDSQIAGEPRAYHVFSHIEIAAMAQVTGIDLSAVYLRLYLLPLIVLLVLELALVGRALARNVWVGPVAAGLMLLIGEVDLDPRQQAPSGGFDGLFFENLFSNPPFLLGLALFLPLVLFLYRRLAAGANQARREWLLVVVFMVGCQGTKVSILPIVVGGLLIFGLWRWRTDGQVNRAALVGIAAALTVMTGSYLLQYFGYSSGSEIAPFTSTDQMFALQLIKEWLHQSLGLPGLLLDVTAPVFGTAALLAAPLVGVALLLVVRRRHLETHQMWLLSLLLAGLLGFFLIDRNYEFFLFYGYVAGGLLSAEQIVALFAGERAAGRPLARLWLVGAVWLGLIALAIVVPLIAFDPVGRSATRPLYVGWYVGLALALLGLCLAGRRRGIAGLRTSVVVVTAILLVGALDIPLDHGLRAAKGEKPLWAYLLPDGMSGGLYTGLTWIRSHTSPGDVMAVNNHLAGERALPRYFYYSAITQRRVFLEDWDFSATGAGDPLNPFPERVALNNAVFEHANVNAMRTLATRYGVTHLIVDRRLAVSPALRTKARLEFSNPAVAVYSIRARSERARADPDFVRAAHG